MLTAKEKSKAFYQLSVELSEVAKDALGRGELKGLEQALDAYLTLVRTKIDEVPEGDDPATVEVSQEILQQMALLAAAPLARIISYQYGQKK